MKPYDGGTYDERPVGQQGSGLSGNGGGLLQYRRGESEGCKLRYVAGFASNHSLQSAAECQADTNCSLLRLSTSFNFLQPFFDLTCVPQVLFTDCQDYDEILPSPFS